MISLGKYTVAKGSGNSDLIVLTKEGKTVSTGPLSISTIRGFLLGFETASYTLNASIKIAKFVASTLGISYQVPTDLSANVQDEKRIIPDEIAMGIVLIQAHKGLEVDGLPGADFIRRAMGLHQNITVTSHCRAAFMDESSNKSVKNASGKPIKIPDFSADESQNYDFLRDITLARNGLWSDVPEVVNLTGLRLEHGSTKIQWDDNISASWLDAQGRKHVKIYTATTEPGDRTAYKTMLPQTMIFVPGYHQGKMPAMRGHRTVTFDPTAKFPARLIFNTNDERGLNLHPGGTTGAIKQLKRYILPTDAKTKSEFDAVLVFMEIFEILSHWGLDPKLPAWNVLSNWANKNALSPGLLSDGKIAVFQDQSSASIKQINVAAARAWTAKKWQNNRASLVKILRSVDASFIAPVKLNKLDLKGLEALITDAHVAGIVQKQCDYFIEPKEVDGLAGDRFLAMLEAGISQEGALANLANNDFLRLAALFSKFNGQSQVLTTARLNYVKQLITQTLIERAKLQESKAEVLRTVSGQAVQENVGTWSILCQVVFGPEMFYEMMRYSLANAQKTGQRYWYYTLIDLASVPKK